MDIDKRIFKILKHLYHHAHVTNIALKNKFHSESNMTDLLDKLAREGYIEVDNLYEYEDEIGATNVKMVDSTTYQTTHKSNCIIENRNRENRKWLIPLLISFISLFISFASNWNKINEFLSTIFQILH